MFSLSFLNTLFLWGVAAASVPLIIHLIKRNRAVKLPFAAMRFLQMDPKQTLRSQRLKQILLLLMRMTAFALLAMAFARPFFKEGGSTTIWTDQPEAAVILVDNSLSMAYENHFEKAVEKVKELLQSFKTGDQVTVVEFSETAVIVAEADKDFTLLGGQIRDRLKPSNRSTNYIRALQTAESILLESSYNDKTIYLISDFQKSGWTGNYLHWTLQPGIKLNFIDVGEKEVANVSVTEVRVSEGEVKGSRREVLVRIKNHGHEMTKIRVMLHLNQKQVAERNVAIAAGEEKIVQFKKVSFPRTTTPLDNDYLTGFAQVQAKNDKLASDNYFYFVSQNKIEKQILAVSGEPNPQEASKDELFFVERAINLPNASIYKLIKTTPKDFNNFDFNDYRAVLLANVKNLGRETLERLTFYVRGGGGLILALGDQVNPAIFNRRFQDLTPAALMKVAYSSLNRENGAILAEVDYQHPIFRPFSDPGHGDPSTALFYQYFQVEPLNSESVLARFDDGLPAILERNVGSGKVILFTSSLDTEWNNLPVKAIFLPLLYQTIQYVAAEKQGEKSFLVGEPLPLELGSRRPSKDDDLWVQLPSDEKVKVQSGFFENTEEPGIYQVFEGNKKRSSAYFAVNIDSKESDLTSMDPEEIRDKIVDTSEERVQMVSLTSNNADDQLEKNQKLWRFAILSVILLLLGETWLANRTYR